MRAKVVIVGIARFGVISTCETKDFASLDDIKTVCSSRACELHAAYGNGEFLWRGPQIIPQVGMVVSDAGVQDRNNIRL